jgi:hypothetical protein
LFAACDFFQGSQLLTGPQTIDEANLASGSEIVAVRSSLPHFFTAERALTDMFVVNRWTCDYRSHETICEVADPVLLLEASRDSCMVVLVSQALPGIAKIFDVDRNDCVTTFPEHVGVK